MASRVVVEWSRSSVRLAVAAGSRSRWRIRSIHSQGLSAPGATVDTLRALLKEHKVPKGAQVIGVVPREQVITRVVKFPTRNPAELAHMVELYTKAQLPYPEGQTVADFHVLSQQGGFTTAAIVACQRDVADRYMRVLRESGLSVEILTVSPWGVLGWYKAARSVEKQHLEEPALVVNLDDIRTDLVLVSGQRILSSRSVGQGLQDWQDEKEAASLLAAEVDRSRVAIRKELSGREMRSIMLTGLSDVANLTEELAQRIGIPVVALDSMIPFKKVKPSMVRSCSPVVVGGVAASSARGLLNLSPPEALVRVRQRRQMRDVAVVSLLLLALLTTGAALLHRRLDRAQRMMGQLERLVDDLEPGAKDTRERIRAIELVSSVLKDRNRMAKTLVGVFQNTPPDVKLEALTFERARKEIVLRGATVSTQSVLDYVKKLEGIEGIGSVRLKYARQRSSPEGERTDFELVMLQEAQVSS